jgi:hypothetical protein
MGFMTRKNGFNETSRDWQSDAGYVGIAKSILKSVLSIFMALLGSINGTRCGGIVETILRNILSIVLVLVTAILGSVLSTAVVILWGASLVSAGGFIRNNVLLRRIFLKLSGWWS